jgi:putative membrane protein
MADKDRNELAEDRTDWAEDRTLMANERTFAGWMRTGLAAVGVGLGFNALFGKIEPAWAGKAIASAFIVIGVFVFVAAERNAAAVKKRLDPHKAAPIRSLKLKLIAGAMAIASLALVAAIWAIDLPGRG